MYYDMSGFDYGILDVVQVLHLRKRRGNYYDCPFCGETHGKLNINVEKNVFRCNRCDASGGMLKLYADLHNVTLSEANQQIREALGKGIAPAPSDRRNRFPDSSDEQRGL